MKPPCKDCQNRRTACHDTCERFKAYKDEREAEKAYTKQMNDSGRVEPYNHYNDMHYRRVSNIKPKTHWGDR